MDGRSLLVSDVDYTLLGDDAATRRFAQWVERNRQRVLVAYNSGRFVESVAQSIAETDLPMPDAIIGGVGTQIVFPGSNSLLDNWPGAKGWNATFIREALSQRPELTLQPEHLLSDHKVSFYGYDLPEGYVEDVTRELKEHGLSVKVVYSSQRDLDVLPAGTGKGLATVKLAEHYGINAKNVIVAGDSGNDLAMFQQGFRGVVVANAHTELKALRGKNIFHAKEAFAAGVLEGVQHWL